MTKIITGNELPTNLERLNPKAFVRQRRIEFVNGNLVDTESSVTTSLKDFKKTNIEDSYLTKRKMSARESFFINNALYYNLLHNEENKEVAYLIKDGNEHRSNNTLIKVSLKYNLTATGSIACSGSIFFVPYNKNIKDDKALYSRYCKFHHVELSEFDIFDSYRRKTEMHEFSFSLEPTKEDRTKYKGEYSLMCFSNDKKLGYDLKLEFLYDENYDVMRMSIPEYELVGLIKSVGKTYFENVSPQKVIVVGTYQYNEEEVLVDGKVQEVVVPLNPEWRYIEFHSYCPTTLENEYQNADVLVFYTSKGEKKILLLTTAQRNGTSVITIPKDAVSMVYKYEGTNKDNQELIFHIHRGITYNFCSYVNSDNHNFEVLALTKDTEEYSLIDSFGMILNPNGNDLVIRNINETEINVEIMSFTDKK